MMKKHALGSEEPRLAGISILVGQDGGPVKKLQALTARQLVQPLVFTGPESSAAHLRRALEEAAAKLAPGSILFLFMIGPGFAWRRTVAEALRGLPRGTRVFGLSVGSRAWPVVPPSRASLIWIASPTLNVERFTDRLLDLWAGGGYLGDSRQFVTDLGKGLRAASRPVLLIGGHPDAAFLRQRPFTVSPPPTASIQPLVDAFAAAIRAGRWVRVQYRNAAGKESSMRLRPTLLGTTGSTWKVLGGTTDQTICLWLERVLSLDARDSTESIAPGPALEGADGYQHCIQVADVWLPSEASYDY